MFDITEIAALQKSGCPIVVNYGMGVDSTAMLVGLSRGGLRPDLIIFADTGGEKPETYTYLNHINEWLSEVGFPCVTVVRYEPTRSSYNTLEGKCLANESLPSLATGGHSCALVFKVDVMDKFIKTWQPAVRAWEQGLKVIKLIGYDAGSRDKKRREKADRSAQKPCSSPAAQAKKNRDQKRYQYIYPLQTWGIDRDSCKQLIKSVALEVPVKSACFFCPASTKAEIIALRDTHPDLYARAVNMEQRALNGKHTVKRLAEGKRVTCKGLGRQFAWSSLANVKASEVDSSDEGTTLRP